MIGWHARGITSDSQIGSQQIIGLNDMVFATPELHRMDDCPNYVLPAAVSRSQPPLAGPLR